MSDIAQWDRIAGNDTSAPPDGAPEGMARRAVNDTMREMMAAVSRFYTDLQGTIVSAGTGNNYTLTTTTVHTALADQSPIVFRADRANTGATTLNVDSLGAKELVKAGGTALASGDIAQNQLCLVVYNPNQDHYELLNPVEQDEVMPTASDSTAGIIEVAVQSEQEARIIDNALR